MLQLKLHGIYEVANEHGRTQPLASALFVVVRSQQQPLDM